MDNFKYLILFPVPEPYCNELRCLMDEIAAYTKIIPPYGQIKPHITFHRPIVGIEQKVIENLIQSSVCRIRQTRMLVGDLFPFGKHYIVLPVYATLNLALLWGMLNELLLQLPEYIHGEFDRDNTLHITVARKTSEVFDNAWKMIKAIPVPNLIIPINRVSLYKKHINRDDGRWEEVVTFNIPT